MSELPSPAPAQAAAAPPAPMLAADIEEVLAGVTPAWVEVFGGKDALTAVAASLPAEGITPPRRLIMEAFRLVGEPADVRVVIVGQDPYPTPGVAHGLAFSIQRGERLQPSLERVFGCLARSGLRAATGGGAAHCCGDLTAWALQGVLLLNMALTTAAGAAGAHLNVWRPLVAAAFDRLLRAPATPPAVLLWGGPARALAPAARAAGAAVHEWTHPSPLADNRLEAAARFVNCNHFEALARAAAAAGQRPVCWDNAARIVVFTDGACTANGRAGKAAAGYSAVAVGGPYAGCTLYGRVEPRRYLAAAAAGAPAGFAPEGAGGAHVEPSNNRGELLGICAALLLLLVGRACGEAEIVSDSEYAINTITQWYPARLAKGTAHELKNPDLLALADTLLRRIKAQPPPQPTLKFTHVRSHQAAPGADAGARERLVHAGNEKADKYAGEGVELSGRPRLVGAPPGVRAALAWMADAA